MFIFFTVNNAEDMAVIFDIFLERMCISLCHPSTQNVENILVSVCTCRKSAHIKVTGKLCDSITGGNDIFLISEKKICFFLVSRCQVSSDSVARLGQLFEGFFGCSFISIRHINTLEMHGRIDGFYFLGFVFRDEIQAPDVLVIFITFNEDRVQIFVNILLKFLVIFLFNPSETEMDELEFQD